MKNNKLDYMISRCAWRKGCLEWTGCLTTAKYPRVVYKKKKWVGHRLIMTLIKGPIPRGMWVLHKCDNKLCLNIEHLYLGTHEDNMRDMVTRRRHVNQKKTHCPKGHAYSKENTNLRKTKRQCRECGRISDRKIYWENKSQAQYKGEK